MDLMHELISDDQLKEVGQANNQNGNCSRTEYVRLNNQHAEVVWHCHSEYHSSRLKVGRTIATSL